MLDRLPNNPVQPESCGLSMAEHFMAIMVVLADAGTGVHCPEAYHALVEFAEGFRLAGNHTRYMPAEHGLGRQFAEQLVAHAAAEGMEHPRPRRVGKGRTTGAHDAQEREPALDSHNPPPHKPFKDRN